MSDPTKLGPGVYVGLEMNDYLRIPALSNTALGHLSRSPAHLRAWLDGGPDLVDPRSIGRAYHALVLEGERVFRERYARAPDNATHKGYKPWKEWVASVPPGVVPMKARDFDAALEMGLGVRSWDAAAFALHGSTVGESELSIVWEDSATGVLCKARVDQLNRPRGAIVDLKSTEDAREEAFSRSIFKYGYFRQAAFYRAAVEEALGFRPANHLIIAHEKEAPWAAICYRLMENAIEAGRDEIWGTTSRPGLLHLYRDCLAAGSWPSYRSGRIIDVTLPPWAWAKLLERNGGRS